MTVSGPDQRGITSTLMELLALHGAVIDDVEQVVVRGRLVLGVIASVPTGQLEGLRADLTAHYEKYNSAEDGGWKGEAEYILAVWRVPN